MRRVSQRIDGDALDAAIGAWLTDRAACRAADEDEHPPTRPVRAANAVDDKSLRGATRADGRRVHLISALRGDGIVLAQREADAPVKRTSPHHAMPLEHGVSCAHRRLAASSWSPSLEAAWVAALPLPAGWDV